VKSVDRHERREEARARFEERMAMPILIAAALLTAVTLVLLFADISREARRTLLFVDLVIWALFAFDYLVRFTLATPKKRFVREEWLDLVLVVLPLLQPLRLAGAIVRLGRLNAAIERTTQGAQRLMGRHKLYIALTWAVGLMLIAAVVTPVVEPDKSKITSFGDGIWWALVTMTTVGYGDLVPESVSGQVIGGVLMLAGIGILSLLTANIATLFLEPAPPDPDDEEREPTTDERLADIDQKLTTIMRRLDL
jgi:voltage-gated potassium channel